MIILPVPVEGGMQDYLMISICIYSNRFAEIYVWFERLIPNLIDSYIQIKKLHVSRDNLDILFTLLNKGSTDLHSHF